MTAAPCEQGTAARRVTHGIRLARGSEVHAPRASGLNAAGLAAAMKAPPDHLAELLAPSLASVRLPGQRTADLHHTLATVPDAPAFAPEPYTSYGVRSLYQSMRGLTARAFAG